MSSGSGSEGRVPASRRIGRYQVRSRLGAGGHGEVWLVWDPQLHREVALKLLSPDLEERPGYRRRLEHEARTSSGLNHPNIVTVYEIGSVEGTGFIAQEFVRGVTLRQQMAGGPLPLRIAVAISAQVAAALEAVHAAGLVHRDIKPENLMIRPDGLVKVLDFGLARYVTVSADGTLAPHTRPGAVVGSLKYLSPEQARGLEIDARSDIFSLGIVMYELMAGAAPFEGPTEADVIAAILKTDPEPLPRRVQGIPQEFDRMVRSCLEKDREKRRQTSGELRRELDDLGRRLDAEAKFPRGKMLLTVATLIVLLALAYAINRRPGQPEPAGAFNSMQITPLATRGQVADAALSPDGKLLAYALDEGERESLWLRTLGTTNDVRIAPPEAGGYWGLTFSAAGSLLYYLRPGSDGLNELYRMPVMHGEARRVETEIAGPVSFSHDGSQYAFIRLDSLRWESTLVVGNADGTGKHTVAIRRRPDYLAADGVAWSPDGRSIACFTGNATFYTNRAFQLVELNLDGSLKKVISPRTWAVVSSVLWSANGRTLVVAASDKVDGEFQIWQVSYQDGKVRRVTNDLSNYTKLSLTADSRILLAVRREISKRIWVTSPGGISHAAPIPAGVLHSLNEAQWTPDGQIVFSALAGDYRNIWIMGSDGGNLKQLTAGPNDKDEVEVTRDGRYILYQSQGKIWRVNLDGSDPRQLTRGALDVHPCSTADGLSVVYASFADWSPVIGGKPTLWKVSINGGEPVQLSSHAASVPRVSPDGKLIACLYFSGVDPRYSTFKVAVMPFDKRQPTKLFALRPGAEGYISWEPDGRAFDYVETASGVGNLWRQSIRGEPPEPLTRFDTDRLFQFAWSSRRKQIVFARGDVRRDIVLISSFN